MAEWQASTSALAAQLTRAGSQQAYYTIRYLVDPDMVEDAYRAYGYFRWVDDWLDQQWRPLDERLGFIKRQEALIDKQAARRPPDLTPEEELLVQLLEHDPSQQSGLYSYVKHMMAVMAFDAKRRGRLVSQYDLERYTYWLAVAVTEALHYFIGHDCYAPSGEMRYMAVTGAHITHMLRDAVEDAAGGYYNIPRELVLAHKLNLSDVASPVYREWVQHRVHKARACFSLGREYLNQIQSVRCRLAGYAYMHRFETLLDQIEADEYQLQARYPGNIAGVEGIELAGWALWMACRPHRSARLTSIGKEH